jgi:hypothetical protein
MLSDVKRPLIAAALVIAAFVVLALLWKWLFEVAPG